MIHRLFLVLTLVLGVLAPAAGLAQTNEAPAPSATELRLGLVGEWSGALGYRDYQSDRLFEIPVRSTISSPGDGATLIHQSLFDDGPNNPVWITTVSLDDPTSGTTTAASFRLGRAAELTTDAVSVSAYTDPRHWTVVYSRTGKDDDAPADIRVTETRDGDSLTAIKEVRPVGSGDEAWRFRNQTRLTRVGD